MSDSVGGMSGSETVKQAREQRAGLRATIAEVERALSSAPHGRVAAWSADLREGLRHLSDALEQHIELSDAPGGPLDDIAATKPNLVERVKQAKADHVVLRAAVARAIESLPPGDGGDAGVARARDRVVELLTSLVRHRHLGADLIYEAYNVDLEASD